MKYILAFLLPFVMFACSDRADQNSGDESSDVVQPNDPFPDLNPEKEDSNVTSEEHRTMEKWYGIDSDDDTVIYEKDGKILTSGYVTGTFERLDRNDFMHYVVKDSNGYLHSFFIYLYDQRQMDMYYDGYEPARGRPVTVKWIRGPLRVSDGGAMQTVYQAKEIIE